MRYSAICLVLLISSTHALEFSSRIKALGTDLAWLIPDYQTDLYRSPQCFCAKMIGIAYDESEPTPLSILLCSRRMGVLARYWLEYDYELEQSYPGWQSTEDYTIEFEDLWMVRIKDEVWNFSNDGCIRRYELDNAQTYNNHLFKDLEYFIRAQTSFFIGRVDIDFKVAAGFYERVDQYNHIDNYNQRIGITSGRIGLYYVGMTPPNDKRFTSCYLTLGGPISRAEINSLPYSIYSDIADHERKIKYFGNTFISRFGWARVCPLTENGFFAIGLRNDFVYQPTHNYVTDNILKAITNSMRIPLAVEYLINKVYVRFGTSFVYDFTRLRESNDTGLIQEDITHEFGYNYSFGIGWQPNKDLSIDLCNQEHLNILSNWSICVKYLF
jgi:hypothetical protein